MVIIVPDPPAFLMPESFNAQPEAPASRWTDSWEAGAFG